MTAQPNMEDLLRSSDQLFRLETLDRYSTGAEDQDYGRWSRGEPPPPVDGDPWFDKVVRATTQAGKRWRRVHMLRLPLTDYLRFELEYGYTRSDDEEWERSCKGLGTLVRYADDWLALCANRPRAEEARRRMATILRPLGLELNPDKTRIVCLTKGRQGLDVLGYHLHKVQSWRWKGRWYLQRWPSARNTAAVRAKIRSVTDRRFVGLTIEAVVDRVNRVLRAWGNHFRYGNSTATFSAIDRYAHERLAIFMGNKHGLPGSLRRHMGRFDGPWLRSLGVYHLAGTVRYGTAHAWR